MSLNTSTNLLKYAALYEKALELQETPLTECLDGMADVVKDADNLCSAVENTSELLMDAKVLNIVTKCVSEKSRNVSVNEDHFDMVDFAQRLKLKMTDIHGAVDWRIMADEPLFIDIDCPFFSPLLGLPSQQPATASQIEKKRANRRQKDLPSQVTQPEKVRETERHDEESVEQTVQRIFSVLLQAYKRNNRKAINYFHFVLHPTSFSSTVENIFHVSFLVRDGFVKLYYDDSGMPVIEPAADAKKENASRTNRNGYSKKQNILSIDMTVWKDLVDILDITEPMI